MFIKKQHIWCCKLDFSLFQLSSIPGKHIFDSSKDLEAFVQNEFKIDTFVAVHSIAVSEVLCCPSKRMLFLLYQGSTLTEELALV